MLFTDMMEKCTNVSVLGSLKSSGVAVLQKYELGTREAISGLPRSSKDNKIPETRNQLITTRNTLGMITKK